MTVMLSDGTELVKFESFKAAMELAKENSDKRYAIKSSIEPEVLQTMKKNAQDLFTLYECDAFEPDSKEELLAKSIITMTHILDELTREREDTQDNVED